MLRIQQKQAIDLIKFKHILPVFGRDYWLAWKKQGKNIMQQ